MKDSFMISNTFDLLFELLRTRNSACSTNEFLKYLFFLQSLAFQNFYITVMYYSYLFYFFVNATNVKCNINLLTYTYNTFLRLILSQKFLQVFGICRQTCIANYANTNLFGADRKVSEKI